MGIYRLGTKFTIREGKLTIFQKDKKYKTDNWYARYWDVNEIVKTFKKKLTKSKFIDEIDLFTKSRG